MPGPAQAGRPAHVSAASGLVLSGDRYWVAVDDEVALASFDLDFKDGRWHPLAERELPLGHDERKAQKPDVESLCVMPDGALLALGSGATERRRGAWLVRDGAAEPVDLGSLYAALAEALDDLNIEGAAVVSDSLWLAQRGNGPHGHTAVVEVSLEFQLRRAVPVELGDVEGVPLGLSDLHPLADGRLAFVAVAESSASTYHDGENVGSACGILDPHTGEVTAHWRLPQAYKVEGVLPSGGGFLLVADPDEAATPAPVLAAPTASPG